MHGNYRSPHKTCWIGRRTTIRVRKSQIPSRTAFPAAPITLPCLFISLMLKSNFLYLSANAYGCRIEVNTGAASLPPHTIYSCTPANSSPQYEVHVLSVFEVINRRPPSAGDVTVNVVSRGRSDRLIILVLGSYEPVN